MRRPHTFVALFLLLFQNALAQGGSWTNKAGHVLFAVPVELNGAQVVFKKDSSSVVFPLSVFLPAEQKRLKAALGAVDVPAGLADAQAQMQRLLKRLNVLREAGRLSEEAHRDACAKARASFREKAAPFVEKGLVSDQDVSRMTQQTP
jgi:hypothetical protein